MAHLMTELEILNAALTMGWVKFSYYKQDGTKRVAIGTRNHELITQMLGRYTNAKRNSNYFENCNGYFDLTRADWRQFNANRFIGLELDRMSNEQAVAESVLIAMSENANEKQISEIERVACHFVSAVSAHRLVKDSQREWCERYNGGRGLNGVLLTAGDNGGSGCLGWPSAGRVEKPIAQVMEEIHPTHKSDYREELKAELNALREKEQKLLAELNRLRDREGEVISALID